MLVTHCVDKCPLQRIIVVVTTAFLFAEKGSPRPTQYPLDSSNPSHAPKIPWPRMQCARTCQKQMITGSHFQFFHPLIRHPQTPQKGLLLGLAVESDRLSNKAELAGRHEHVMSWAHKGPGCCLQETGLVPVCLPAFPVSPLKVTALYGT